MPNQQKRSVKLVTVIQHSIERAIISSLKTEYEKNGNSYGVLAKKYGINKGEVWRIINRGKFPEDIDKRNRLGFPESIMMEVPLSHTRICICGCDERFVYRQWNHIYKHGHRKK